MSTEHRLLMHVPGAARRLSHMTDLPETYAQYFELRQLGLRSAEIASRLGIPPEAWETFVALAHAKLARSD